MDQGTPNVPTNQNSPSYEMPPDATPPEPMGGQPPPASSNASTPVPVVSEPKPVSPSRQNLEMPKKPVGSYIVIILLILLLVAGVLVFAAWKGWISLGGLSEILNGGVTTTATPSAGKISPQISPVVTSSPSTSSSPAVTVNVNDETRKKDLANLKNALEKYFTDKAGYPLAITKIKTSDQNNVLIQALVPNYLSQIPDDPLAPKYYYSYKSDGQSFELTCVLEDKSDNAGKITGDYNVYTVTSASSQ